MPSFLNIKSVAFQIFSERRSTVSVGLHWFQGLSAAGTALQVTQWPPAVSFAAGHHTAIPTFLTVPRAVVHTLRLFWDLQSVLLSPSPFPLGPQLATTCLSCVCESAPVLFVRLLKSAGFNSDVCSAAGPELG